MNKSKEQICELEDKVWNSLRVHLKQSLKIFLQRENIRGNQMETGNGSAEINKTQIQTEEK
jgi:hypothetical protein